MEKLKQWLINTFPWYTENLHSILMYLVMGGITTLINIVSFLVFCVLFKLGLPSCKYDCMDFIGAVCLSN